MITDQKGALEPVVENLYIICRDPNDLWVILLKEELKSPQIFGDTVLRFEPVILSNLEDFHRFGKFFRKDLAHAVIDRRVNLERVTDTLLQVLVKNGYGDSVEIDFFDTDTRPDEFSCSTIFFSKSKK